MTNITFRQLRVGDKFNTTGPGSAYVQKVLSYNPFAYWPLTDASGTVATSLVDSAQDGTYQNVTLNVASGPFVNEKVPIFSSGPGALSLVDINTPSFEAALMSNANSMTYLLWGRVADASTWLGVYFIGLLIEAYAGTDTSTISFSGGSSELYYIHTPDTLGVNNLFETPVTLGTTEWFSMVVVIDQAGTGGTTYFNGTAFSNVPVLDTWVSTNINKALVGSDNISEFFSWDGQLAHLAFFPRPLSSTEVASITSTNMPSRQYRKVKLRIRQTAVGKTNAEDLVNGGHVYIEDNTEVFPSSRWHAQFNKQNTVTATPVYRTYMTIAPMLIYQPFVLDIGAASQTSTPTLNT